MMGIFKIRWTILWSSQWFLQINYAYCGKPELGMTSFMVEATDDTEGIISNQNAVRYHEILAAILKDLISSL